MTVPAPLRGTQSLVGQMGWVFARPFAHRDRGGLALDLRHCRCWWSAGSRRRKSSSCCRRSPRPRRPRSAEPLGGSRAAQRRVGALPAARGGRAALASAGGRAGLGGCLRAGPQPGPEAHGTAVALTSPADDGLAGGMAGGAGRNLLGLVPLHPVGGGERTSTLPASRTWWVTSSG